MGYVKKHLGDLQNAKYSHFSDGRPKAIESANGHQ